jgi:hypothetical protein
LPYVYEFLLNQEIVSGVLYRDILDKVALMKAKLVAAYPHQLWKYDFVHRWTPPDAVSAEEFASEAALFADSFRRIIPLDDPLASEYYECEETPCPRLGILQIQPGLVCSAAITTPGGPPKRSSSQKRKPRHRRRKGRPSHPCWSACQPLMAPLQAAWSLRGKLLLLRNWIRNFPTALYVFRIHKAGRSPDAEERVVICGKINLKR